MREKLSQVFGILTDDFIRSRRAAQENVNFFVCLNG